MNMKTTSKASVFSNSKLLVPLFKFYSRSYYVGEKCLSLRSAHFTPRVVVLYIKNGAIHIYRFPKMISHISFPFFGVNCAFLAVSDYAFAARFMLVSLGYFASAEATKGFALWTPTTFEQR